LAVHSDTKEKQVCVFDSALHHQSESVTPENVMTHFKTEPHGRHQSPRAARRNVRNWLGTAGRGRGIETLVLTLMLMLFCAVPARGALNRTTRASANTASATISVEIARPSAVFSDVSPHNELGSLGPYSVVRVTIPASALSQLAGRDRISSAELSKILKTSNNSSLTHVEVETSYGASGLDKQTKFYMPLRSLLDNDGARLGTIDYDGQPPGADLEAPEEQAPTQNRRAPVTSPSMSRQTLARPAARDSVPTVDRRTSTSANGNLSRRSLQAAPICIACQNPSAAGPNGLRQTVAALSSQVTGAQASSGSPHGLNNYKDRADVRTMMASARRRTYINYSPRSRSYFGRKNPRQYTGFCYHYIKDAIYDSGMVPRGSLTHAPASDAAQELSRQGFTNLLNSNPSLRQHPENAPVGSIIVYAGDRTYRYGDIQIKTEDGFIADYFSPNAMTHQHNGAHFHVVGVMVKP
jgi:hypothetical protein